jgi:hypothetical protein
MLPRLTAETSLLERERIAVGTGALSPEAMQSIVKAWAHQADPDRSDVRRRPKKAPPADMAGTLAGLGLGYEVVKRG